MPTLNWIGKEAVENHHNEVPFRLLKRNNKLSVGAADSGNLLVQGDNLEALKALLPYYAGKVKCIYIDPPYNTGNENWVYNDNVTSPEMKDWLGKVVGKEGEDLSRSDKWLCMMFPRVALLKNFLSNEGVIIVHIDEHEIASLFMLLDTIFGKNNRLGYIVWDKGNPKGDAQGVAFQHETILCYALKKDVFLKSNNILRSKPNTDKILQKATHFYNKIGKTSLPDELLTIKKKYKINYSFEEYKIEWDLEAINTEFQNWIKLQNDFSGGEKMYKYIDEDGHVYRLVSMAWPNKKKAPDEYFLPIIHPKTKKECPVPARGWRYPPDTIKVMIDNDEIIFGKDHKTQPQRKYELVNNLKENLPSILKYAGSDDPFFKKINLNFENPKPYIFSKILLESFTNEGDLILDSFAGSGTTGHAIFELNLSSKKNRNFILVEIDENTCKNKTQKRLKELAIKSSNKRFSYCKLGPTLFNAEGQIREEVLFNELARHVYFCETGEPLPKTTKNKSPLLGIHKGIGIYLLYNGILKDKTVNGGNVLISKVLARLPKHKGKKVIYGTACRFSDKRLRSKNIIFKQTPYEIRIS